MPLFVASVDKCIPSDTRALAAPLALASTPLGNWDMFILLGFIEPSGTGLHLPNSEQKFHSGQRTPS